MLHYDFKSSLGYWICSAARNYERALGQELLPQGITFRQCQVLAWLALERELSQVELADRMNIEPPTLVRVLDRMERDGLLSRKACASDRRIKLIRPLPKAKPIWKTIMASAERVRTRASSGLTTPQRDTLKKLLAMVQSNLLAEPVPATNGRSHTNPQTSRRSRAARRHTSRASARAANRSRK